MTYQVIIPEYEWYYVKSKKTRVVYWKWKDKEKLPKKYADKCDLHPLLIGGIAYCATPDGERFIKNSKKANTEKVDGY